MAITATGIAWYFQDWAILKTALSLRVGCSTILGILVVAFLLSLVWEPLMWLAFPIGYLAWVGALLGPVPYCPECGKRVKLNYARCHHCGYVQPPRTVSE